MRIAVPDMKIAIPRPPEFKAVSFHVKATNDTRYQIEGILNAIGNVDEGLDRTMPGAFKKTVGDAYSRKSAQHLDYLWPYLWNHDPNEPPIGGIYESEEIRAKGDDPAGLFIKVQLIEDIQRARDVYSCFKSQAQGNTASSGLLKQSMGYKTILHEFVPEEVEGRKVNVRNLREVQVWEGSAVVFPMNDLSIVSSVKSGDPRTEKKYFQGVSLSADIDADTEDTPDIGIKTVCGSTSGPIGPRDESWDGAAAKKWIWSKALDADGKVKASVAKKYFMRVDGDPGLKGSYSYPFWIDSHISVGGVKAVAGALSGARNADAGGDTAGMRRKVAALYRRINSKYPDAPQLEVPWKSTDEELEHKDFAQHYADAMCEDLIEDFSQVLLCALCCSIYDAIKESDEGAVSDALGQFADAVEMWTTNAIQYRLPDYLENNPQVEGLLDRGNIGSYPLYYMSNRNKLAHKAGARISNATRSTIQSTIDGMHDRADQMMSDMQSHSKAIKSAADDLTQLWDEQGQDDAYAEDDGTDGNKQDALRTTQNARREPLETLTRTQPKSKPDDFTGDDLEAALASFNNLKQSLSEGKHANTARSR
jgi:HK97 family phage prohead protease